MYKLGYLPEPPDERDLLLSIPSYDLPKSIDWTSQITSIKNQGSEGSCTAFSSAALSEFFEWKQYGQIFDLSERWVYEWAKKLDCFPGESYEGSTLRAAMKALQKYGICEEKFWKYIPNKKGEPDPKAAEDAYKHRIKTYRSLTHPKDIRIIKRALHEVGPIVAGVAVQKSWFNPNKGIIKDLGDAEILGYHAILVIAYGDGMIKIKNSWGENWGINGFGYLNEEYFMRMLHSAWAAYDL